MSACAALARIFALGVLMAFCGYAAAQPAYPNKPIRVIVPYAPGGSVSTLARLVSQKLTEGWGAPVIVDNRPGGNTVIGAEAVARALPDGYTILWMAMDHVIVPHLLTTPFDPIRDFAPVATIASSEYVLVTHPSVPASNLREFIALAKSSPGQLNFASASSGSSPHLAAEFFSILAGVKMQHIPYKGAAPAIIDLIGGQVQLYFSPPIGVIAHIKAGRLKALAISGETRLPALAQVPTFTEAGLPGLNVKLWYGVLAPAGTQKEIIDKLSTEIAKIMAIPDLTEKLVDQGMQPFISTPDQFATLLKADMAKFARIIKTANIKLDN